MREYKYNIRFNLVKVANGSDGAKAAWWFAATVAAIAAAFVVFCFVLPIFAVKESFLWFSLFLVFGVTLVAFIIFAIREIKKNNHYFYLANYRGRWFISKSEAVKKEQIAKYVYAYMLADGTLSELPQSLPQFIAEGARIQAKVLQHIIDNDFSFDVNEIGFAEISDDGYILNYKPKLIGRISSVSLSADTTFAYESTMKSINWEINNVDHNDDDADYDNDDQ